MTVPDAAPTRASHPLWRAVKARPLDVLPIIGFLIALISFAFVAVPAIARGNGEQLAADAVAHSYVLVWMLAITTAVRTVGIRQVMTMFLSGFFLSTGIAILLTGPLLGWLGSNDFTVAFWVPVMEELAKVVPLALLIWAYHRRHGQFHGVSELMVLGFAVGAGMAMHEDIFYGRSIVSSNGTIAGAFTEPWGALFPSFHWGFGGVIAGHAAWGAVIGFGVGLASVLLRQWALAIVVAAVPLAIAVVDHTAANMRGEAGAALFDALSLQHRLVIWVLILGFVASFICDIFRRRQRPPELPRPGFAFHRSAFTPLGDGWRTVLIFFALGHYRRGWTSVAYARSTSVSVEGDISRIAAWYQIVAARPARSGDMPVQ